MRHSTALSVLLALTVGGCGPSVSDPALGEVHYHVPHVPGTEHPYVMPQLDDASKSAQAKDQSQAANPAAQPATPAPAEPNAPAAQP